VDPILDRMRADQEARSTGMDPVLAQMRDMQDQAHSQAALTVAVQADQNPDQAAIHGALAKRYNVPVDVVAEFPQEFKDRMALELARSTLDKAPQLQQRIVQQPQTAALIHDDLPNAAGIERVLTPVAHAANYLFSKGEGTTLLRDLGQSVRAANATVSPVFTKIFQAIGAPLAGFDALAGTRTADVSFAAAQWFDQYSNRYPLEQQAAFSTKLSQTLGGTAGLILEALATGGDAPIARLGQAIPTIGQRVQHGIRAMLVPSSVASEHTAQQVIEQGGSPSDAVKAGVASYLTNTAGGVFPFATPGSLATRFVSGAAMGFSLGDVSRQLMNATLPEELQLPLATGEDHLLDIASGMLFGGMVGPRPHTFELARDTASSQQAEVDFLRMSALGQLSAASKWRERDAEGFRDFVRTVTEDGDIPNVYIEAQAFAQSMKKAGLTPDALREQMPELAAQMSEAALTDGFVRIPTADYATKIAGTPLDKELLPLLRTDPEGKNFAEAQAFYQDHAQRMQDTAAELVKDKQQQDAFRESQARMVQELQGRLDALGRFTPDVNKVYAGLQGAIISRIAAHEGIGPEESMAKYAPLLANGAMAGGFEQGRAPIISGLKGDEAVAKLQEMQGGEAVAALHYPELGDIDLVWGKEGTPEKNYKDGYGLAKIAAKHPEMMEGLQEKLLAMDVVKRGDNRVILESKDHKAAVSLNWAGQEKRWLLSAYSKEEGATDATIHTAGSDKTGDSLPRAPGEIVNRDADFFEQERRGAYLPESRTIALLKDADLSTYLHETGHWALDTYSRIALGADAPPEVRADMARVLKWFGVESIEKWHSLTLDEQRPFHEKFARGFEAYLMEGKAPSRDLVPFFQRIRAWMVNIYRSLRGLDVELTSEVRSVFDRMLASDEAIQEAQAARVFEPLFKEKPAGMTAEEWAAYRDMGVEATNDAIEQMQAKSLRDMKWLSNAKSRAMKDLQKQAKSARDSITREVEEEVGEMPVYRMQDFLKKLGKEAKDYDPEQLAETFGFPNGNEALRALAEAAPRKEVVEGLIDRYMIERHGELASPEAIDAAASAAVHNDARARFVATGLRVLTKSPISATALLRGAKEAAQSAIGARRIRDLNVRQHEAAESRANRDALRLVAKDPMGAAVAQRASLLNNQLVKATQVATEDVRTGLTYLDKLQKPSTLEKIQLEFRDQIQELLGRYDLRKGLTPEQAAEKSMVSLESFVEKLAAMKFAIDVPESLVLAANRMHFKDMTVDEFRGLIDAVKSLEHLGREVQKVQDGKESRMLADVAAEAMAQTEKLPKRKAETNRGLSLIEEKWLGAKSFARSVQASLLKMEQMIDWLDDYKPNGVFNRLVFRKIADAESRRNDLDLKVTKSWEAAISKLPKEVLRDARRTYVIDGAMDAKTGEAQRLTWNEKIALAGIRGDATHFSKLLRGEKWDPQAVLEFLDKNMSKEEWQFVHDISGTFQELFPLKQEMLREMGSSSPKEVARIPFQTPHGELPGWYWPITYDPARSHSVKERTAKHESALFEDNIFTRADTSTGREMTRNDNYAKPMLLSIDVLPRVLKDEIRDITMRRAVIEADRFLRHPDVRRTVEDVLSPEHYDQFNGWLLSLANDAAVKPSELQMWDRLAHELRTRTTMVGLGFRISTMVMHGATAGMESVAEAGVKTMAKGVFNKKTWGALMKALGPEWLNRGLESFSRDSQWVDNRDFIFERSAEMRHRMNEIERDVREQLRDIHIKLADPALGTVQRAKLAVEMRAYQGIAMLDMASALPTWMGAYLKGMSPKAKGGLAMSEADAVYFADKTVRNAHGGGGVKDMAAVQRGNEFQKLFTMFYTFWNHNINRIIDTSKRVGELPRTFNEAKESGDWAGFRGDVGTLVLRSFAYTMGVQAIHHMMHPPKEEDGEEGWLKWFGKQMALSAFGGVPIFRDIVGHYAGGKDYEMSPTSSIVHNTDRLVQDLKDGSTHERWIKHAMTEAGYILGMPLGQPGSSVQFLADVWDGKQHPEDIAEWWRGVTTGEMQKH
jgi:hypothetical protein